MCQVQDKVPGQVRSLARVSIIDQSPQSHHDSLQEQLHLLRRRPGGQLSPRRPLPRRRPLPSRNCWMFASEGETVCPL